MIEPLEYLNPKLLTTLQRGLSQGIRHFFNMCQRSCPIISNLEFALNKGKVISKLLHYLVCHSPPDPPPCWRIPCHCHPVCSFQVSGVAGLSKQTVPRLKELFYCWDVEVLSNLVNSVGKTTTSITLGTIIL